MTLTKIEPLKMEDFRQLKSSNLVMIFLKKSAKIAGLDLKLQ